MFALVLIGAIGLAEYTIDGKIVAIQSASQECTILRENGKRTTVKIAGDVFIDGKRARFAEIKKGQEVRAVYDLDTKNCRQLSIFVEVDRPPLR